MLLGVVGVNGRQCKRLLENISETERHNIELVLYEHRKNIQIEEVHKDFRKTYLEADLSELLKCDGIIISSPNDTHYQYLSFFIERNYRGFVLCEKPPVETYEELEKLNDISDFYKTHILFGFNLRFSKMRDCMGGYIGDHLGKLIYCNIINGHGLALKPEYKNSWRNDNQRNALGVYETVMVHYIDLFLYILGTPSYDHVTLNTLAADGRVPDNCTYEAHKNSCLAHFYVSYTMPYMNTAQFVFENGIINMDDNRIELCAPRETFDRNGNFAAPPVIKVIKFDDELWSDSYKKMMQYFIGIVETGGTIPAEQFNKSLESNRYILKHKITG